MTIDWRLDGGNCSLIHCLEQSVNVEWFQIKYFKKQKKKSRRISGHLLVRAPGEAAMEDGRHFALQDIERGRGLVELALELQESQE